MIRNKLFIVVASVFFSSCNSKYSVLVKYYNKNISLHKEMADSLINFCKLNQTDIIIRKQYNGDIFFSINFKNISSYIPIEYDSLLNRRDPSAKRTSRIIVPNGFIRKFKNSIYSSIRADSNQVFLAYKYYDSEAQYGILIDNDKERISKDYIKMLSPNACIYKGIIP